MYKRRDIREAAVQFLYFSDIEEKTDLSDMLDAFWQMIQERSLRKLAEAKAKAVLHVSQGRDSRMEKLRTQVPVALEALKATGNLAALSVPLRAVLSQESKLSATIELLRSSLQSKSDEDLIGTRLEEVFVANHVASDAREALENALEDYPQWKNKWEGVLSACRHLGNISKRLNALETLDSGEKPTHGFEHLHASEREIRSFRQETETLIRGVLEKKESIDKKLAELIDNFTPERVVAVDKAILRVGGYEILYRDDIPRAVSINEAIEISRKFGTSESSRFVNGILDAL